VKIFYDTEFRGGEGSAGLHTDRCAIRLRIVG
jgi:hypothetical protein